MGLRFTKYLKFKNKAFNTLVILIIKLKNLLNQTLNYDQSNFSSKFNNHKLKDYNKAKNVQ